MKLLLITLLVAYAAADVSHIVGSTDGQAKIVKQEQDVGLEGQYKWAIETSNGIIASEQGSLDKPGSEDASQVAQGEAQWTAPNGELIQLQYIADANGYQPQGSHLPVPPPIPEAILRALEYIRTHPPAPEKN